MDNISEKNNQKRGVYFNMIKQEQVLQLKKGNVHYNIISCLGLVVNGINVKRLITVSFLNMSS